MVVDEHESDGLEYSMSGLAHIRHLGIGSA